jgi:hypothetical protein
MQRVTLSGVLPTFYLLINIFNSRSRISILILFNLNMLLNVCCIRKGIFWVQYNKRKVKCWKTENYASVHLHFTLIQIISIIFYVLWGVWLCFWVRDHGAFMLMHMMMMTLDGTENRENFCKNFKSSKLF